LNEAYWVVDDIYTVPAGDFENLFLPLWLRVVDEIVRASVFLDRVELGL
jgi:hypothetical protein